MDAGTIVAIVLGAVGFVWGAVTFFVNRADAAERDGREYQDRLDRRRQEHDDELERRWLAEKRLIYAKAQASLTGDLRAQAAYANLTHPAGPQEGTAESIEADAESARQAVNDAFAEIGLMAPGAVVAAFAAGTQAVLEYAMTVQNAPVGAPAEDVVYSDAFARAVDANTAALNAMRADLGLAAIYDEPWRATFMRPLLAQRSPAAEQPGS